MASIINASTSGVGGVITTADNSGDLNIQSGGATKIAVTSTGAAVTGTLSASGGFTGNAATASNVLGNGQTWQDVTASRALSTTYTNSTGRSIEVFITIRGTANSAIYSCTVSINGTVYGRVGGFGNTVYAGGTYIIPAGATYAFAPSGSLALDQWSELR